MLELAKSSLGVYKNYHNARKQYLIFEQHTVDTYQQPLNIMYFTNILTYYSPKGSLKKFAEEFRPLGKPNQSTRLRYLEQGKPIEGTEIMGKKYITNRTPYEEAKEFLEASGFNPIEVNQLLGKLYYIEFVKSDWE